MTLQPYKTDVAVLILFFNRPDHLKKVFDEVRKARPSRLFLYQDGPRGERDMPGIEACRRVVENIDWQCEVHRKYQERNYGCDPSEYISQKWAFSIVDKCIVLEDDDVPSQSFFPFCKQMLDRYEHDNRVWMVAGFNPEEKIDSPYDYMFTSVFSIWGWASWRRVIDTWDETYAFLDDPDAMQQLEGVMHQRRYCLDTLHACYDHRASGKAYYETIFWASMVLNSGLAIMPTHNMINNLGATDGSTHYTGSLQTMPRRLRRLFTMQRFDIDTANIRHPRYVVEDVAFKNKVYRTYAYGHPWIKAGRSLEELWLNLRYGNFGHIRRSVTNRLRKIFGKAKHW